MRNLAVCLSATKSYLHAFKQCIQSITAAVSHYDTGHFIYACDDSEECKAAAELIKCTLPENWKVHVITHKGLDDTAVKYQKPSQIVLAKLQGSTFAKARQIKADLCFSVESDVLLTPDALRVLEWALDMPNADGTPIYDISAGTYNNGLNLLGFGTPAHPIEEDFLPHERKLPRWLKKAYETCEGRLKSFSTITPRPMVEKEQKRLQRLLIKIKKCPPDGQIWQVTAKHGWRRRGWLDNAMPGCVAHSFHSDWCGLGVTLMSKKALALADFNGYDGGGTQDLFLCWRKWYPAGLKINGVPHIFCDHVKRNGDKIEHRIAYRETEGEYRGHMRTRVQEWVSI